MVVGNGPTRCRHETEELADEEAQRLARENPGQVFVVTEAIKAYGIPLNVQSIGILHL